MEFTLVSVILPDVLSSITPCGIFFPFLFSITNPVSSPPFANIHASCWLSLVTLCWIMGREEYMLKHNQLFYKDICENYHLSFLSFMHILTFNILIHCIIFSFMCKSVWCIQDIFYLKLTYLTLLVVKKIPCYYPDTKF